LSAIFTIEHHDELEGIGTKTHAELEQEIASLKTRVEALESKKWYQFTTLITSEMVDTATEISENLYGFSVPLGVGPGGIVLDYRLYEHLNVYITGMQQRLGEAVLLTSSGTSVIVVLPENPELWNRYRSGLMELNLEWYK
jgi:hypothetical protein